MVRACRDLLEAGTRAAERTASVVNVSSLSAFNGKGSSIAYAASKGALNTLTVSLARALAPSIRVNAVVPGFIDTPWIVRRVGTVERAAKTRAKVQESMPLKLATGPEDVARVIRFLAIDATHMTGELVRIDAGNHLL